MTSPAKPSTIWALIPAAGIGSRMGSTIPKQYLEIDNTAILEHSIRIFLDNPLITNYVVALHAEDAYWQRLDSSLRASVLTVNGGDERYASVINGLKAVIESGDSDDWVLVHDAARPCLSQADLNRLLEARHNAQDGALLALPAIDTIKQSHGSSSSSVASTLDRSMIWQAQTPQLFRAGRLLDALERVLAKGIAVTDESSAIEVLGGQPLLVRGSKANLKITEPEDLALATFILQSQINSD